MSILTATRVDTDKLTRVEVIDYRGDAIETGRVYAAWDATVTLSAQDGGRTLKVFVEDNLRRRS